MLAVQKISKSFGATEALSGVSLEVASGSTGVIIGPSGCGKTTLVRVVMGLVSPDRGQVRFNGEVLGQQNTSEIRHGIDHAVM